RRSPAPARRGGQGVRTGAPEARRDDRPEAEESRPSCPDVTPAGRQVSEPSPGSLLIESERRTARMQTSLVVEEGRRSGNAGDASRYRPEALHSLDASRFIGVSSAVSCPSRIRTWFT